MRFIVENSEAKRILELHSKLNKNIKSLTEQATNLRSRLDSMMRSGCVGGKNLFIQEFEGYAKPDYQYAIAQESTKTPGKFRYLFIDNNVGQFDATGKWQWVGKWSCEKYTEDKLNAAEKSRIDNLKTTRGAKTYEEWQQEGVEVMDNPDQFDEFVVGSTKLYARKQFQSVGTKSAKAQEILKNIADRGGKLENEVNDEERDAWTREVVVKPGGVDFPNGLVAFFPPNADTRSKISDKYTEVRTNVRLSDEELKNCEENIKQWYEDWSSDVNYPASTHTSQKQIVQACVNQLKLNKLKRAFSKTDDYIDQLTGAKKPGPYSDDKYRLKAPRV